jgi:hypothetical protein
MIGWQGQRAANSLIYLQQAFCHERHFALVVPLIHMPSSNKTDFQFGLEIVNQPPVSMRP